MSYDLLIRNGTVVDGTGATRSVPLEGERHQRGDGRREPK